MDPDFEIDDHPSVRIIVASNGEKGILRLSSLYGSHKKDSELDVQEGEIVRIFCPHCNVDMKSSRFCYECKAPMITFESLLGGYIRVCSRWGCKKQLAEFENLETELRAFHAKYSLSPQGRGEK
ncbi:MAG: hypothetical protein KKH41_07540 [Candidatus Thermoplasmatota archaeon]|nr:hypothetical protein [Candidatus Thermoplasmatota archaeon]